MRKHAKRGKIMEIPAKIDFASFQHKQHKSCIQKSSTPTKIVVDKLQGLAIRKLFFFLLKSKGNHLIFKHKDSRCKTVELSACSTIRHQKIQSSLLVSCLL